MLVIPGNPNINFSNSRTSMFFCGKILIMIFEIILTYLVSFSSFWINCSLIYDMLTLNYLRANLFVAGVSGLKIFFRTNGS
jgi:hypothetical protein